MKKKKIEQQKVRELDCMLMRGYVCVLYKSTEQYKFVNNDDKRQIGKKLD